MNCKTFYGKRSTSSKSLNQLIDQLHEERFDSANVYINPPREDSDGELSENDNDEDVSEKFSSKILAAPAEATLVIHGSTEHRESSSDDDEPLINYVGKSKKIKLSSKQEKWYNQDLPVLPETVTQKNDAAPDIGHNCVSKDNPLEFFALYTKEQTILYATQQNANTSFSVTVEELKVFFAILLISGYSKRPRKDMYWSMDSDLRNEAVARGMSRNKFRDILRNLHFVNNGQLPPGDKFAKVRPLIDHLNSSLNQLIDQLHEERFDSANVYINPPREDSDGELKIFFEKQEKWYNQDLPVLPETLTQKNDAAPDIGHNCVSKDNPLEFFALFWNDTFFEYTKEQTILYATQQNANTSFSVTVEELKVFFAILLISGYSKSPRKDMYWSMDSDLRNEAVARGIELGLGASVVSTFANRLKENFPDQKFNFFIDNFFTGLPLIKKFSALDYECTGTIRQNRIEKCPLNKSTMKKSLRGSMSLICKFNKRCHCYAMER
nr:unnamed protein product [Callosobruchus analis]